MHGGDGGGESEDGSDAEAAVHPDDVDAGGRAARVLADARPAPLRRREAQPAACSSPPGQGSDSDGGQNASGYARSPAGPEGGGGKPAAAPMHSESDGSGSADDDGGQEEEGDDFFADGGSGGEAVEEEPARGSKRRPAPEVRPVPQRWPTTCSAPEKGLWGLCFGGCCGQCMHSVCTCSGGCAERRRRPATRPDRVWCIHGLPHTCGHTRPDPAGLLGMSLHGFGEDGSLEAIRAG